MSKTISQIGELGLINIIQRMAPLNPKVIKGIGDDAAVIGDKNHTCNLLATDMLIEGVHFNKNDKPHHIGNKALASNMSDIAAMGGYPQFALVSIGLPKACKVDFVKEIYKGMKKLAAKYDVSLIGGDTVKSSKIVINVAVYGEGKKKNITFRKGAEKGDIIFTTGTLGGSLKSGKHLKFKPRVSEGLYLAEKIKPSAMIDISDGLVSDLKHIADANGLGAVLYEDCIPKSKGATTQQALYDGEDFELLFTLNWRKAIRLFKHLHPFRFFPIGEMIPKPNVISLIESNGKSHQLKDKGYRHFR